MLALYINVVVYHILALIGDHHADSGLLWYTLPVTRCRVRPATSLTPATCQSQLTTTAELGAATLQRHSW